MAKTQKAPRAHFWKVEVWARTIAGTFNLLKMLKLLCICPLKIFDVSSGELVGEKETSPWQPRVSDAGRPGGHLWTQPFSPAHMPQVRHPFSPLKTEKGLDAVFPEHHQLCSLGLGASPQPQAAQLTCDPQPILLPHNLRLRSARTQPLWAEDIR